MASHANDSRVTDAPSPVEVITVCPHSEDLEESLCTVEEETVPLLKDEKEYAPILETVPSHPQGLQFFCIASSVSLLVFVSGLESESGTFSSLKLQLSDSPLGQSRLQPPSALSLPLTFSRKHWLHI